jgi:hypothetical protein
LVLALRRDHAAVTFVEHYAVAPAGDSFVLAHVAGEGPFRLPDLLAALESVFGTPVYLRLAARCTLEPGHELDLRVFDEVAAGPAGELELVPAPLRPALEAVLTEFRGAPPPRDRPAWARPGWHSQAEAWAGNRLSQVGLWPLSAVLRGASGYMKAVFPLFHHEPAVTQALAREHPGAVPEVWRVDHERGWMLMPELPGTPAFDLGPPAHEVVLRTIAEIHRAWRGRAAELLALGAQDRRVEAPELAALPETLVHGDFHPGNAFVDGDCAVIFDWSDACVAHPLFDLHLYLHDFGEGERDELVEAYASGWNGEVDADTIRELLPLAAPLSFLHQAESYRAIEAACAPDDRWWFAGEAERWRELAAAETY